MSRIGTKFKELKRDNRKALITFITAGDPDIATTAELVLEMERRGADIIELGIPYSDPVAEGPVIQAANARALKSGIRLADIITAVSEVRKKTEIPLIFLLYFNCILQYGTERFFRDCAEAGVDGVILPDLPYEERGELLGMDTRYAVDAISMIAPTSRERIQKIAKSAKGFLYCVSSMGVTGERNEFSTDFETLSQNINRYATIPTAIGFGISTPEQVKKLKEYADGLIIGSAIVRQVERSASPDDAVKLVGDLVAGCRKALDDKNVS